MTLDNYLSETKITNFDFAKRVKVSAQSISNYRRGLRKPEQEVMKRIYKVTGGLVDANSFFLETSHQ